MTSALSAVPPSNTEIPKPASRLVHCRTLYLSSQVLYASDYGDARMEAVNLGDGK